MLTRKDISCIDKNYFDIIQMSAFVVVLRSRCTGHFWALTVEEFPTFRHFKMEHKHKRTDTYHRHKDCSSMHRAVRYIKNHDMYQLSIRNLQ